MTEIELHEELKILDSKIATLLAKTSKSQADCKELNLLCDQVEEIRAKLDGYGDAASSARTGGFNWNYGSNRSNEERRYAAYGRFLQAAIAAGSEPGRMIGEFSSGAIRRDVLYGERRSTGMEESLPSAGGFLVGMDFSSEIIGKIHETGSLYSRCRRIPISANANGLKLPYVSETSRADASRLGGVTGSWLEEGGTKVASKPKFGLMELALHKVVGLCYLTEELMQDKVALGAWAVQAFTDELKFKVDDAILNGDGAGKPLGILNAACLVSVAKETGQPAATINWENLKKMYTRFWTRSRANMVTIANQDTLAQLMGLNQPVGVGGIPVWTPANGAANQPFDSLLGRPLLLAEQAATLGTVGDILFADLSQYLIVDKPLQSVVSMHVAFTTDEDVLRVVWRVAGQPLWAAPLTPFKGGSSQSPFIALATRS